MAARPRSVQISHIRGNPLQQLESKAGQIHSVRKRLQAFLSVSTDYTTTLSFFPYITETQVFSQASSERTGTQVPECSRFQGKPAGRFLIHHTSKLQHRLVNIPFHKIVLSRLVCMSVHQQHRNVHP